MLILKKLWLEVTNPRVADGAEPVRQEYLTRVIYMMVGAGLAVMTVLVVVISYMLGELELESILIMGGDGSCSGHRLGFDKKWQMAVGWHLIAFDILDFFRLHDTHGWPYYNRGASVCNCNFTGGYVIWK